MPREWPASSSTAAVCLSPHRSDGVGGRAVRELRARAWAPLGRREGGGRSSVAAQGPMAVCLAMRGMVREYTGGNSQDGPGWREFAGIFGCAVGLGRRRRRQAGSGMARSRARARLNWVSQGQLWGRCRVRRRAERVIRPAREKNRRRRVLVVTTCSPRPVRELSNGPGYAPSPVSPARRRWRETARRHVVQPHAVLQVSNGVLDLGMAAVVGLQLQGFPVPVGDEAVIAVGGGASWELGVGFTRRTMSRTGAASGSLWKGV